MAKTLTIDTAKRLYGDEIKEFKKVDISFDQSNWVVVFEFYTNHKLEQDRIELEYDELEAFDDLYHEAEEGSSLPTTLSGLGWCHMYWCARYKDLLTFVKMDSTAFTEFAIIFHEEDVPKVITAIKEVWQHRNDPDQPN